MKCKYCERRMAALQFKCWTCNRIVWRPIQIMIVVISGLIVILSIILLIELLTES